MSQAYFNDALAAFLGLERGTLAVYAGSESSRIALQILG